MFSAQVADATGSAYVTFFNDTAQTLVGRSADEVAALRDTDPDLYDEVFTSLYSKVSLLVRFQLSDSSLHLLTRPFFQL